jgi:hypothetical protein
VFVLKGLGSSPRPFLFSKMDAYLHPANLRR